MNIICNSCVGSRLYELMNVQYNNPFMWNVIPYTDFRNLIINYDNIDFSDINVSLYKCSESPIAIAKFNKSIFVYYIHYHQNDQYEKPVKKIIDIHYKDIIGYTKEKIINRTKRMIESNEDPIFIFETRPRYRFGAAYTDDDVIDFINLETQYTKIVITSFKEFKNIQGRINNCYILFYDDPHPESAPDTETMAKIIYDKLNHLFIHGQSK